MSFLSPRAWILLPSPAFCLSKFSRIYTRCLLGWDGWFTGSELHLPRWGLLPSQRSLPSCVFSKELLKKKTKHLDNGWREVLLSSYCLRCAQAVFNGAGFAVISRVYEEHYPWRSMGHKGFHAIIPLGDISLCPLQSVHRGDTKKKRPFAFTTEAKILSFTKLLPHVATLVS